MFDVTPFFFISTKSKIKHLLVYSCFGVLVSCGGGSGSSSADGGTTNITGPSSLNTAQIASNSNITGYYPADKSIGIPDSINVTLSSSVPVATNTLNDSNIYILAPTGNKVPATYSFNASTITINPTANLLLATSYTVVVTPGLLDTSSQSITDGVSWTFTSASGASAPKIAEFTDRMITYGKKLGDKLLTETNSNFRLDDIFYDAHRVFIEIGQYTGQVEPWKTYANKAKSIYLNDYLVPNNYKVAGWMRFPHGLYRDWEVNGNAASKSTLITLRDNGQTSAPEAPGFESYAEKWKEHAYSRPIAYSLENNMLAERAGAPRKVARVNMLVDMALGHIEQWTTGIFLDAPKWHFVQSFMTGLTSSALIEYYDRSVELGAPDTRVPAALKKMADWLWVNMWVGNVGGTPGAWSDKGGSGYGAFRYVVPSTPTVGSNQPSPILNQLIGPSFAWLYKHTCDVTYKQKADLIFSGGIMLAKDLSRGKFFNQQHREVFNYLKWRDEGDKSCS